MEKIFEGIKKQVEENGRFETHIGGYATQAAAIDELTKQLQKDGGVIYKVLQDLDASIGLHNVKLDIKPVQNSDGGYDIFFSVIKVVEKKQGGK